MCYWHFLITETIDSISLKAKASRIPRPPCLPLLPLMPFFHTTSAKKKLPPPPVPIGYKSKYQTHTRSSIPPTAFKGHKSLPVHPRTLQNSRKLGRTLFNIALGHTEKRGSISPALPPRPKTKHHHGVTGTSTNVKQLKARNMKKKRQRVQQRVRRQAKNR